MEICKLSLELKFVESLSLIFYIFDLLGQLKRQINFSRK